MIILFRKILALGLSALIICSLAGCKDGDKDTSSDNNSSYDTKVEVVEGKLTEKNAKDFVELCDYKTIKIDWTNSTNDYYYNSALSSYTPDVKEIKNRAVKNGDIANIDFEGFKDGVAFDGGTAQGQDLNIGSGQFIEGFEEGLVGVKPGETVDLNLTFPENYGNSDLAGQPVVFKVKVNYIKEQTYKDADIKAAKESVYSTVVINQMVKDSKIKSVPKDTVDNYIKLYNANYTSYATQSGYKTLEEYVKANGMDMKTYNAQIEESSIMQTKNDIIAFAVVDKEKIELTDKEYKELLTNFAGEGGDTVAVEKQYGKDALRALLATSKAGEFLAKNIKE